jgi:hypothetical protein
MAYREVMTVSTNNVEVYGGPHDGLVLMGVPEGTPYLVAPSSAVHGEQLKVKVPITTTDDGRRVVVWPSHAEGYYGESDAKAPKWAR